MSETVKLIIEIPKDAYRACRPLKTNNDQGILTFCVVNAVADGIPLDDVKAEIEKCKEVANVPYDRDYFTTVWAYDDAIRVLDNIGKGDSEC